MRRHAASAVAQENLDSIALEVWLLHELPASGMPVPALSVLIRMPMHLRERVVGRVDEHEAHE